MSGLGLVGRFTAALLLLQAMVFSAPSWNLAIAPDTVGKPLRTQGTGATLQMDLGTLVRNKQFSLAWDPIARTYTVSRQQHLPLVFIDSNPWARAGDSIILLQQVPERKADAFWVSTQDVSTLLPLHLGWEMRSDSSKRLLSLVPSNGLLSFTLESRRNGDMAEIRFAHPIRYESLFHAPHFLLRFHGLAMDSSRWNKTRPTPLVKRVLAYPDSSLSQLTFQLQEGLTGAEVIEKDSGRTLQVVFRKPTPPETTSSSSSTATSKSKDKQIRTIIIDPGHGGKDPGALGSKVTESQVVLAVAKKLKEELRKAGFQVRLTRETDVFVELRDRPKMASQWEGDLFLSLHCNAVEGKERRQKTEGFKVFILRESESEEDKAIARRENQAAMQSSSHAKDEISPVDWILLQNQLNLYTRESERIAGHIVEEFDGGSIRKLGSGAGQAGFYVLVGAFMPAALVELGFITNANDEANLASEKNQQEMARKLAAAVSRFAKGSQTP